ncbi:uncharacterized protein MEPE_00049 [Melanopsichium pennsylvanicum]|uniref:Zn(2)-C6 fungal-type domain-containing protein n=2 Tax=Melanopsichium pennsylvanicum TaxID=63383 RepID=A0AAJ5C2E7_9BASI|nr:potential fungal zinc cluster transcription factor [Melanopsichium pennsylvanicum 4]SNX81344.1 uncharacterized protein MEPE_00049 [Melanopsichium pennsylvanicum]
MEQHNHAAFQPRQQGRSPTPINVSTTGGLESFDNSPATPRIQKRPRRTHARRSCLMCQQRKARCELPNLEIPSSPFPLPNNQACHRCKTLQISCIVDDTNKKKSKKLAHGEPDHPAPAKRRASAAGRRLLRRSSTDTSHSSSIRDAIRFGSASSSGAAGLMPSGVALTDVKDLKFAGGREFGDQIVYPAEPRLVSKTPESSSGEDDGTPPPSAPESAADQRNQRSVSAKSEHIRTQEGNPRDVANIDIWERFSTRSRPLTLLTELVPRQNGFASKVFRLVSARATIETDVTEIISNDKSKILSDWCEDNLTLWMPHISNAYQIRQEALQGKQTLSTQLLEQVLYLIAMQHVRNPEDDVLRFSVTRFVIRDSARLMMTSPRSSKAVEALELLALFPVDVSAIPGPSRNRIRTDSQISAAERFARSVRLDRVALTAAAPYSFFVSNNQLDDFETKRTAMEWASVKTWYNCFTMGDDELYESVDERFFNEDWTRSLMLPIQDSSPETSSRGDANVSESDLFSKKRWSRLRRIGSIGLAMRCLAMKQLLAAFNAIRNAPIDVCESERLSNISTILNDYKKHAVSVENEFRRRLAEITDGGHLLCTWLTIETTAGYLLVLGAGILRGLGIDRKESVPANELALLVRGENASPGMRDFLTRYGEHRFLAAENVLVQISTLCKDAKVGKIAMPNSVSGKSPMQKAYAHRWMLEGQSRTVLPMMNICGYALEAAFNAMEMHATMFKLWKTPPKRSDSWQLVFSNVITAMLSIDPNGSIQSGSIPATCAYILQGMLKVIVTWTDCSRKKEHQRTATNSSNPFPSAIKSPRPNGFAAKWKRNGPSVGGGTSDTARYSNVLSDDFNSRKSFDAVQAVNSITPTSQLRGGPNTASVAASSRPSNRVTASMLEDGRVYPPESSFHYNSQKRSEEGQFYVPNSTESLAAALPYTGHYSDQHIITPSMQSNQQHYLGPYRGNSSSFASSASSSSSVHIHTPNFYEPEGNGVTTNNGSSNGSTFSFPDTAGGRCDRGSHHNSAFDSLDFILNDVLGSSEWSGILQDIWRTDM